MPDHLAAAPPAPARAHAAVGDDWTVKATDAIDSAVGLVRDKAVVPATRITRWAVYGALAGVVGVMTLVLFAVAVVRVLVVLIGEGNVWAAHLVAGGIFTLAGLFLWSKRRSRKNN